MIDSLVVLGNNLFRPGLSVEAAVASSSRLGLEGMVAAPARDTDYSVVDANDRLARDAEGHPGIRRLVRVDPNQGRAAENELRRGITELGCVGLFLNPDEEVFRIQDAEPVVRVAAGLGIATVIVAGVPLRSEALQILELSAKVPDARLILSSGGQVNITGLGMADAWIALERNANIAVLSNGEYRQDYLERIVRELGPERLLLGTMAPYYDRTFEIARIENIAYSASDRALVVGGNARRIFG